MEQLLTHGIKPGDQDLATKSLVALKNKLAEEKLAREKAQTDAETFTRAIEELKNKTDKLVARFPSLED
jgi:hypothetical protein